MHVCSWCPHQVRRLNLLVELQPFPARRSARSMRRRKRRRCFHAHATSYHDNTPPAPAPSAPSAIAATVAAAYVVRVNESPQTRSGEGIRDEATESMNCPAGAYDLIESIELSNGLLNGANAVEIIWGFFRRRGVVLRLAGCLYVVDPAKLGLVRLDSPTLLVPVRCPRGVVYPPLVARRRTTTWWKILVVLLLELFVQQGCSPASSVCVTHESSQITGRG